MNIVLTNDDGIDSGGLAALYRELSKMHTVTVAAPASQRSAAGHSLSLHQPLRVKKHRNGHGGRWYAVSGTPADCVKLGLLKLLEARPDLVISGINAGVNDGVNTYYSGTVAAAREACLNGIPALAVSMAGREPANYESGAVFTRLLTDNLDVWGISSRALLNVNMPDLPLDQIAGVRFTRLDMAWPGDWVEKRRDTLNGLHYRYGYSTPEATANRSTDREALGGQYISVTPLLCDLTDEAMLKRLKKVDLNIREVLSERE